MALIDVTELLSDPDFVDEFAFARRTQVMVNGRVTFTTQDSTALGSVQINAPEVLDRFPDAGRPDHWIRIYTLTRMVAQDEAAGTYGDLVAWQGRTYQVKAVDDWSNYGAGYVKALARLVPDGAPV
jgi:hypothetical protein